MDKWLNDIHDRMKDYGEEPPQGLWEALDERMRREGLPARERSRHGAWAVWPRRMAVAACVAVAVLVGYRYVHVPGQESATAPMATKEVAGRTTTSGTTTPDTQAQATSGQPVLALAGTKMAVPARHASTQHPAEGTHAPGTEAATQEVAVASAVEAEPVAQATEETAGTQVAHPGTQSRSVTRPLPDNHHTQASATRQTRPRLTLAAYTAGATGSQMSTMGMTRPGLMALGPDNSSWQDSPALGMAVFNQGKVTEHSVHHRLPVRVGASFSYDLTRRLALGSGLTYTRLRSDLRDGTEDNYQKSVQSLHYMGIPVTLRYTFLNIGNLSLYAQGGALAELRVAGKRSTTYILDGQRSGEEVTRIHSHALQMSATVAAGVQYHLTPTLAAYAEPGVSHYFGDGSCIPTIYQEKPTNFSLNVGVRLCLGR